MGDESGFAARRMKLGYNVQLWKEDRQYVAHAMPLDVASSGPTPAKARAALKDAVDLFLKTAQEAGTLDQVLEETGYTRGARGWLSPKWLKTEKADALLSA
jgi:predicted RNase H-like HicB family nuclease